MRRQNARPVDQMTMAQALKGPNMDTRQWVSYGIVTAGGDAEDIIVFDEEEGVPFVNVMLEPTKVPVFARVGAQIAGNGEGEWFPFVEGDEVLCAVPEGDEKAGVVILCRLNNQIDQFPMDSVAGQDPTTNTFAFQRRRTPMVNETAGPVYMRTATTGAFFSIDTAGTVTAKDGQNSALQLSPDLIGFQGPSDEETPPEFLMQLNLTDRQYSLQVGDAVFNISASDGTPQNNILSVPSSFTLQNTGNFAAEHVVTIEALCNILTQLGLAATTAKITSGWVELQVAAAVAAAAGTPLTPATTGAITLALAGQGQKTAVSLQAGRFGVGCPGFVTG